MLSALQTSSLLGAGFAKAPTSPYDLITGETGNVTLSALSSPQTPETTLTQQSALQGLKDFVGENVEGDEADKLMLQIEAVELLMATVNEEGAKNDPAFALLKNNAATFGTLPTGSLVNGLL